MRYQRVCANRARPLKLAGDIARHANDSRFVRTANAVFEEEIQKRELAGAEIVAEIRRQASLRSTQQIVRHIRDDAHAAIDVLADLVNVLALAVDQVRARSAQLPQPRGSSRPINLLSRD